MGNFRSIAISCVCTPSNGVRSRRCIVCTSTSCSRQFSSPPVSCRYSRCRPSCAQANVRIPRSESSVTTRAAGQSTPAAALVGATQTFSTPSCGAIQASMVPSGDIRGLIRSGLPKSTCRGMSSVKDALPFAHRLLSHMTADHDAGGSSEPLAIVLCSASSTHGTNARKPRAAPSSRWVSSSP